MVDVIERLRYGSKGHINVRAALRSRIKIAQEAQAENHPRWQRAEEDFRAYTPESQLSKRLRNERKRGNIEPPTLTVPYSYAQTLSAHTYLSAVFLSRTPVMQYLGRKGTAQMGVQGMEALHDYNLVSGEGLAPLYLWILDPLRYGYGVVGLYWTEEVRNVASIYERPVVDPITGEELLDRTETVKEVEQIPGYKGNKIYNIRPYDWFPDPRVPLIEFQRGEFCGRASTVGWQDIMGSDAFFNKEAVRDKLTKSQDRVGAFDDTGVTGPTQGSEQYKLPLARDLELPTLGGQSMLRIFEIFVRIIPKEWGLGEETASELWVFTMINDEIIVGADPAGFIHDKYPFAMLMYEPEAYTLNPRGILEIGMDINSIMSWLVNSHIYNVRRTLNDQIIYDPSRLNAMDMLRPGPGKLVRATPQAYGQDVKNAYGQLQVTDITRSHITDTQMIAELGQRVTGINDNMMGINDPGGRKTATEIRSASNFGISRLRILAEFFSSTGFQSLSRMMVSNSQQFYDDNDKFRVVGNLSQGMEEIEITPQSIAGEYDYVPVDGTLPVDRFAQANLWKEIMATMANIPSLAATYDFGAILNYVAQLSGIRNLSQFQLEEDDVVKRKLQTGELVPNDPAQRR